jgi:FkbM family methyltransferase
MPQKITATILESEFLENFGFNESSGLYQDPNFRLVINKFGRCYWLLAHDNLQGPRFSGNNIYYQGNNARLIRTIYPNAKRIIDVGANVGNNTIAYSEFAEHVESFEPTPTTLKMLEANIAIAKQQELQGSYWHGTDEQGDLKRDPSYKAGWYTYKGVYQAMDVKAKITVHKVAATNRNTGTIDILDHTDHGGHNHVLLDSSNVKLRASQQLVPVPARTIDSYNFDNVDAIKIDVEGSELLVMQGAEGTIRKHRPSVQVEIVPKQCNLFGYNPQALYDFFDGLDYVCVSAVRKPANADQRGLWFGKDIGMRHQQIKKYMDRLFVPREVHDATDYKAMDQVNLAPEVEKLFDFG